MKRTVVLNDFGELSARTTKRKDGSQATHYTTTIRAEPVLTAFDAKRLGKGPALAIAAHLRQRVSELGPASPATIEARKRAARILSNGTATVPSRAVDKIKRRYANAKQPPNTSDKLFNDTGRMRDGIKVGAASGNRWIVNVPRDRMDPSTLGGDEAALVKIYTRLQELIPEWGNARALRNVLSVRKAIKEATPLIDPRVMSKAVDNVKRSLGKLLTRKVNVGATVDNVREYLQLLAA